MANQLNDLYLIINNEQVAYTADSLSWKDGLGDANVRNAVAGGRQTESIYSEDLESRYGMVKFSLPTTVPNEARKRSYKLNRNENVIQLVSASNDSFNLVFTAAVLSNDPESTAATDGNTEFEFKTNPAQ